MLTPSKIQPDISAARLVEGATLLEQETMKKLKEKIALLKDKQLTSYYIVRFQGTSIREANDARIQCAWTADDLMVALRFFEKQVAVYGDGSSAFSEQDFEERWEKEEKTAEAWREVSSMAHNLSVNVDGMDLPEAIDTLHEDVVNQIKELKEQDQREISPRLQEQFGEALWPARHFHSSRNISNQDMVERAQSLFDFKQRANGYAAQLQTALGLGKHAEWKDIVDQVKEKGDQIHQMHLDLGDALGVEPQNWSQLLNEAEEKARQADLLDDAEEARIQLCKILGLDVNEAAWTTAVNEIESWKDHEESRRVAITRILDIPSTSSWQHVRSMIRQAADAQEGLEEMVSELRDLTNLGKRDDAWDIVQELKSWVNEDPHTGPNTHFSRLCELLDLDYQEHDWGDVRRAVAEDIHFQSRKELLDIHELDRVHSGLCDVFDLDPRETGWATLLGAARRRICTASTLSTEALWARAYDAVRDLELRLAAELQSVKEESGTIHQAGYSTLRYLDQEHEDVSQIRKDLQEASVIEPNHYPSDRDG